MPLALKVGRKYINRDNVIIEIVAETRDPMFKFTDAQGKGYSDSGAYHADGTKSRFDLIGVLPMRKYTKRKFAKSSDNGQVFKIEDNIPLPGTKQIRTGSKYPLDKMKVTQSFLVPCSDAEKKKVHSRVTVSVAQFKKKNKGKDFTTSSKDPKGVRIWRIK